MAANHHFSEPVEIRRDELFTTNRRVNGLDLNLHNNNFVKTVSNEPSQWEMVVEQAGQILSSAFPHSNLALQARGALIRSSLRGDGRSRWR